MKRAYDDCLRAEVQHEEIWKEDGIQESWEIQKTGNQRYKLLI